MEAGLPQGAVLPPLLYSLYTADVPTTRHVRIAQYADDTAFYTVAGNALLAGKRLQDALDRTLVWIARWRIRINPAKTQVLLVRPRRSPRTLRFIDRDCAVKIRDEWVWPSRRVKYLGVTFDHHLRWTPELASIQRQIRRRAALIFRLRGAIHGCETRTLIHTYKCFVRPVVEYRWPALVTRGLLRDAVAKFERGFLRRILRLPLDLPSDQLYDHPDVTLEPLVHRLLAAGRRFFETRSQERPEYLASLESFPPGRSRRSRSIHHIPHPYEAIQDLQDLIDAELDPET